MRKLVPQGTFQRIGQAGGGSLAAMSGVPGASIPGAYLGGRMGSQIARLTGFGDYVVRSNTLMKSGGALPEGAPIPAMHNIGRETRVCHREFIGDVVVPSTPTAFTNVAYRINPGDSTTFPWLSPIASQYQQYKINGCIFEFKTLSSDITAGGALGAVILATDYDVNSVQFPNKSVMENSEYAVSAKPSLSQVHAIECDPELTASKLLYIRDSTQGLSTADNRLYDLGNFQIATSGLPGSTNAVLGELWVSYDISLYKPEVAVPGGITKFVGVSTSTTSFMGASPTATGSSGATASVNTITYTSGGTFLVSFEIAGSVLVSPVVSGTAATTILMQSGGTNLFALANVYKVTASAGQTSIFAFNTSSTLTSSTVFVTKTPITPPL
jgi:hypothetical protein